MSDLLDELADVKKQADLIHDQATMEQCYDRLAVDITDTLKDRQPVLLPVMQGGVYLCGQLMQRLNFPLELDYLHATRYRDKLEGTELNWLASPSEKIRGRTVLVIDDILDQGITLAGIIDRLILAGATEVQTVAMTVKQCSRKSDVDLTYQGLDVPDRYVFGCGMDYKGYWRNLPQIFALKGS